MNPSLTERARHLLLKRADRQRSASRLDVDFYRIRRRVAYPLPVRECRFPGFPTRLSVWYPWDCWLAWAIEERVCSLGWAGAWLDRSDLREAAEADLRGLGAWRYIDRDRMDGLAVAHFVRTMTDARQHWHWLSNATTSAIVDGLVFLVDMYAPWLEKERLDWDRRVREPDHPEVYPLHNIHYIETLGLCLAARSIGHAQLEWLEMHVERFTLALLDQHHRGVSESSSYNGFILDFMVDWALGASSGVRERVLGHPQFEALVQQSTLLSAPGNVGEIAKLGDVEPVEMPFHFSAMAKLRTVRPMPIAEWALQHCDPNRWRTDALAAIANGPAFSAHDAPPTLSTTACEWICHSGWTGEDVAVAMSVHQSPMGHLHLDNGSLVLAAGGKWIIDDPGYQQYMDTSERPFTVGPAAHNCPRPNGQAQTHRAGRPLQSPTSRGAIQYMAVDLRHCYDLPLSACNRHVWLIDKQLVVVADHVEGNDTLTTVDYSWHGHPDASWWAEDGQALVHLNGVELWIRSLHAPLEQDQIDRLRGSRGYLTLSATIPVQRSHIIWWVFSIGRPSPKTIQLASDGRSLRGDPWTLELQDRTTGS